MELAAYVGLDWADRTHAVCLELADGSVVEEYELEQKPEAIHDWVAELRQRFGGQPVGIVIEQRSGPHWLDSAAAQLRWILPFMVRLPKSVAGFQHRLRSV